MAQKDSSLPQGVLSSLSQKDSSLPQGVLSSLSQKDSSLSQGVLSSSRKYLMSRVTVITSMIDQISLMTDDIFLR